MQFVNRIVLIDDDPICHLISTKMIRRFCSSDVETFTNPIIALEQFKEWANTSPDSLPDVVLLDIQMPQMTGWEFLEEFQKLPDCVLKKTSVMMLSSSINSTDIIRSKSYHSVKQFFSKPLSEQMVRKIAGICNAEDNSN